MYVCTDTFAALHLRPVLGWVFDAVVWIVAMIGYRKKQHDQKLTPLFQTQEKELKESFWFIHVPQQLLDFGNGESEECLTAFVLHSTHSDALLNGKTVPHL